MGPGPGYVVQGAAHPATLNFSNSVVPALRASAAARGGLTLLGEVLPAATDQTARPRSASPLKPARSSRLPSAMRRPCLHPLSASHETPRAVARELPRAEGAGRLGESE